jgi:hypothetical protein
MKHLTGLTAGILLSLLLFGQKDDSKDYAKMKEELTEKIFGSADPYFKDNKIPDQYKNESAVILAQKHSLESDSKFKFRIGLFSRSGVKYNFFDIFRRKMLINDQSALEEYSQLSFTKLQSKDWSPLGKLKNYTYINIRVIKPDGKIKTVNVDESAVTLKDEKDEKKNKIVIPDLGMGDIIDYYVANYYQEEEGGGITPLIYVLGDDYPILNYVISLQFDSRIAAEYQSINGAPDFTISPDEDGGGNVLNMVVKNVPKIKGLIWSSLYRQLPIIRLNYKRGTIIRADMPDIKEGKVQKTTNAYADMIETKLASYLNDVCYSGAVSTRIYKTQRSDVKSAWKDYIAKNPKANNPDSIAAFVFRYINWTDYFGSFSLKTDYNNAYFPTDLETQLYRIAKFGFIMQLEFKTDIDFLVVSGKNSYARDNLFSVGDLSVLVKTSGPKPQYFSFGDNFDYQNTIPYLLQGEKARVYPFDTKQLLGGKLLYVHLKEKETITLPSTDYKDNYESEIIMVKTDAPDPQLLNVSRKISATGYLKKDEQAALTIFEEMAKQSGAGVGQTDDIITQNNNRGKAAKKEEPELQTLLEKARTKHKEDFENEIKRNYDVKAKELKSFRILNFGTTPGTPFEFEEEFVMEGWVKKAGNNYIVDIGKFIASQIAVEKDQRERTKDVYMPFPRSFSYHCELTVPEGYTAEGVDKLNSKTENETGAFIAVAKQEGGKVIVDIKKYYNHSFEPSSKWSLLLAFLDKALDFNQQKLLLKKK